MGLFSSLKLRFNLILPPSSDSKTKTAAFTSHDDPGYQPMTVDVTVKVDVSRRRWAKAHRGVFIKILNNTASVNGAGEGLTMFADGFLWGQVSTRRTDTGEEENIGFRFNLCFRCLQT